MTKPRILIVDDNEDILSLLSQVLVQNYELLLAANGQIARQILDNEILDLVISDIMMPGIDGFELCKLIKTNLDYCHIPVVLLTVQNTYQSHIAGLEVGADLYVQKPFTLELLQMQVANLLDNRLKIKAHFASSPFEDVRVVAHSKSDEAFLKKLDDYIRTHIANTALSVEELTDYMQISRPTFYRKVKSLSSLSPKELIDVTRLKKASRLIAQNEYKMLDIAKMTGYTSQSLFTKSFQRYFKISPMEYFNSLKQESNK